MVMMMKDRADGGRTAAAEYRYGEDSSSHKIKKGSESLQAGNANNPSQGVNDSVHYHAQYTIPGALSFPHGCDWACYLDRYPDLALGLKRSEESALEHYILHGSWEGRDCSCVQHSLPQVTVTEKKAESKQVILESESKQVILEDDPEATGIATIATNVSAPTVWWKDINYRRRWRCGGHKCYFRSISDPKHGYLVGSHEGWDAYKAYSFVKKIEAEHKITHLFSGPPFGTAIPDLFREQATYVRVIRRFHGKPMFVQPCINAPAKSILYKCNWIPVLNEIIEKGNAGFQERFIDGLVRTIRMVESEPLVANDLQMLVDPKDGQIYHVDLDRGLQILDKPASEIARQREASITCLEDTIDYVKKGM